MYDYLVYHKGLRYSSPEGLKYVLLKVLPLTKEFIDWVAKQGFKIVYDFSWKEGTGNVWWGLKQIMVSPNGTNDIVNLTLVHELIHIAAVPGSPGQKYEDAIDEIAKEYIRNREFMDYIREKIPFSYEK